MAGGRYEAQNNVWGADTPQCITAFDTGFVVDPADHHKENDMATTLATFRKRDRGLKTIIRTEITLPWPIW